MIVKIDKDELESLRASSRREISDREETIISLSDALRGLLVLLNGDVAEEVLWCLESASDNTTDLIAQRVAIAESVLENAEQKYFILEE